MILARNNQYKIGHTSYFDDKRRLLVSDRMTCQFGRDEKHLQRTAKIVERSPICLTCWLARGGDRASWAAVRISTYR